MKIQNVIYENTMRCPECGGLAFDNLLLAEKKDACYHKVKATAKVWPSAYASGRLVQCRKKGAANWGNKSEGVAEGLDPAKKRRLYDLIELYRDATEPNAYYDRDIDDPDEVIAMIRSEFGDKIADQVAAGAEKMHYPRHGIQRSDPLGGNRPVDRMTKAGKMYKQDTDFRKRMSKYRMGIDEQGVAEAGPFSYGANKPRKGSVADLAAKKRKEQEKGKPPIEPKDQMVGVAKVTKGVAEGSFGQNVQQHKLGSIVTDKDGNRYKVLGYQGRALVLQGIMDKKRVTMFPHQLGGQGVAEAFGPLPQGNQTIQISIDDIDGTGDTDEYTVNIERVGKHNDHIGFAWHDSRGREHYEEVPVGDLGSYDDLISRIKGEIQYQERRLKQGVAEASVTKQPQPYNDPDWLKKLSKKQLDALTGPKYKKDKKEQGVAEGRAKAEINFDIEDIKRLEQIDNLESVKQQAFELISRPSAHPMKPEKVSWFKSALERMDSPMKVIKLMYDLYLSGEGKSVLGTRHSMDPNSYRRRFGESQADDNPVANAIYRRLMNQKPDLFTRYGLEYVAQAVQDVADSVGSLSPDDEIGSSDVSGWVRQIEQNLQDKINQYDEPMSDIDRMEETHRPGHQSSKNPDDLIGGRYEPDEFDQMVLRLKAMAEKQQRERGPVDLKDLARRLQGIK